MAKGRVDERVLDISASSIYQTSSASKRYLAGVA